jgi:hypothetical protein
MLDLAIAANFVRELTEEQFAEQGRSGRRGTPTGLASPGDARAESDRSGRATRTAPEGAAWPESDRSGRPTRTAPEGAGQATTPRSGAHARRRSGLAASRLGRTLARLAPVRG